MYLTLCLGEIVPAGYSTGRPKLFTGFVLRLFLEPCMNTTFMATIGEFRVGESEEPHRNPGKSSISAADDNIVPDAVRFGAV